MKNEDEFLKWNGKVWNSNLPLIESFKPLLFHKGNAILLDLSLKIQAYDFGVLKQAIADFEKSNLEGKSVKDFVKQEKETYSEKEIKKIKERVDKSFKSSFDNERSKKAKELVLNEELSYIIPVGSGSKNRVSNENYQQSSIKGDFKKNWLPQYNSLRKDKAKKLQKELIIDNSFIGNLQYLTFKEVISLANKKTTLYSSNEEFSIKLANLIGFLERSIEVYFKKFIQDLELNDNGVLLLDLRRSTRLRFNTVCWRCGGLLYRKDGKHYCTRGENRCCYEARFKENRRSEFPEAILRTKNKCDNCGKHSSLNHIHKYKGEQMQFCSNRCWETFRKREWRKKKKDIN